jgi:hypothetical protein
MYASNGSPLVDHVIRYENMDQDLRLLESRLGIDTITMPRAKGQFRKDRRHYSKVLSAEARSIVERVCANEIRYFGYRWDGPAQ